MSEGQAMTTETSVRERPTPEQIRAMSDAEAYLIWKQENVK